jgi:hypothetical protein
LELTGPRVLEAAARAESARARGRRRTESDIRAALTAWEPQPAARAGRRAPAGEADTATLVASMSGLVTLDGPGYAVSFADGRFAGLLRQGRQLLAGQPAESYLVVGGKRVALWTESAFSFERDDSSGLRSVLKGSLPSGEAELVTQAFFPAREKHLQLDCVLRLPDLPPGLELEAVAPLELPLFRFARGDYVEVTAELSQRTVHSRAFPALEGEALLYGTRFRLARDPGAPRLTLAPGPPAASGLLALPVRVVRVRREFLFLVSPFGSCASASAAAWSGKTLRFSLRIGLESQLSAVDGPG